MLLTHLSTALLLSTFLSASQSEAQPPRKVAIVVYQGVELLDFAGPGEVFSAVRAEGRMAFDVFTVAGSRESIVSQGFVEVTPEHTFEDCPAPDIVVVPGGNVPLQDLALREFVLDCSKNSELVMSVCNGAGVLAAAGLLDGLEVTTHHGSLELVQTLAPTARVLSNRRFVDHGNILTSAGVSAGIDGALHVVARLHGADAARATARYMEYDWRPDEIAELHARAGELVPPSAAMKLLALVKETDPADAAPRYLELARADEAFSEARVNRIGYGLLNAGRGDDALRILQLVCAAYPDSANACDSVAEVHEALGHSEEALTWSRRALERIDDDETLEPERAQRVRKASAERIERLEAGAKRTTFACPPCGMPCDAERLTAPGRCKNPSCGLQLVEVGGGAR